MIMIIACITSFIVGAFIGFVSNCKGEKSYSKVHLYITRDKDGFLGLWLGKPFRTENEWTGSVLLATAYRFCSYNLNKKDYKDLKWEDEPVEVFLNLED